MLRPFFVGKNCEIVLPLKHAARNAVHAEALGVCIHEEGISLFDAAGKALKPLPILAGDSIDFYRVAQG